MQTIYKKLFTIFLTCGATCLMQQASAQIKPLKQDKLYSGFKTVPDSVQTSVYWYWISGNISKEGVVKDLESMKKVGINRAFIGNIGLDDIPYGKVKMFTPEWWDILHAALKTATKLKIDIGIFNSPGWSQSGGPWVKPEQAMRYLASSALTVKGPLKVDQKLTQPHKQFQDVRVIAFPAPVAYGEAMKSSFISAVPVNTHVSNLVDGDESTVYTIPNDPKPSVTIDAASAYTARSFVFYPAHKALRFEGDIQARDASGTYQTVKHFVVDRSNDNLNVGFSPYSPAAVSIPATTSNSFRIVFNNGSQGSDIAELKISASPNVENYAEKSLAKMYQTPLPYWKEYQWQPQPVVDDKQYVIDPQKVIDISNHMQPDGTLKWDVPAGNWIIMRTGMTPTQVTNAPAPPEGRGLEVDKMSKKHIAAHFDAFLGQIIKRIPAADRKSFKVTVEDSYETGSQNFTDDMLKNFKAKYGYDALPYLPVLSGSVVGSQDQSDRFLWDLRRFVADKVAYDYVGGLRDVSHKNGLTTWLENYGHWGFPGEFLQYGGQSDEIGGEFWSEGDLGNIENRAASSSAHIYGKTKVSAESFTCAGGSFTRYPAMMKQRGDRFFTEGINNTLLHVFISQLADNRVPGNNAWFSNEFNRNNTWFYDMDLFLAYIKRCNYMLRQGNYVADVAYFIGEDAPKMTGVRDPELPPGYSFDYINAEVLNNRAKVVNGRLVLPGGMSYKVLVLPKLKTMRPQLLKTITKLANDGLTVLGPKPERSPSLENYGAADAEIKKMSAALWADIDSTTVKTNRYGKGLVISGMDLQQTLDLVKVKPDCKFNTVGQALFIHRKLSDGEMYFVSNQTGQHIDINAAFRVQGKTPELWDATTGQNRDLPQFKQQDGVTTLPLKLDAYQSAFVIFRKPAGAKGGTRENFPDQKVIAELNTPWSVTFDAKRWGPAKPVIFDKLVDWTLRAEDSIKYYSGAAVYHNAFNIAGVEKGKHFLLDLGDVKAMARVKVNGIAVGGVWTAPYQLDITAALKTGVNTVDIEVVNTWVNRLIGDSKLPVNERHTWTNVNPYKPDSKLEASGLTGPVVIKEMVY
ncbi:glycosyl hydrolase [Mucilaginibacter celer]|uniref:Glycoside hydrolase family 2 n=1 Tax=Mucilaginibacter celer TaxID=2305508 RepID=A0A494W019_9SPHI|nr:glycosyl hydrolase [Mucilaginibacter celer]AYL96582.1 glycoside hydrolase family 2 [Mucilaginibacter celer]